MTAKKTAPDPLIIAISNRLCKMDASSREKRALDIAAKMFPEEFVAKEAKPSALVIDAGIDPGKSAEGKIGFFWDLHDRSDEVVGLCDCFDPDKQCKYGRTEGGYWMHFQHIPTSSEMQKRIEETLS